MKRLIYLVAAMIALTATAALGSTPARAMMSITDLRGPAKAHLNYIHCRRVYHCYWTVRGYGRVRRCHVCG
jgi:hypothetical protein